MLIEFTHNFDLLIYSFHVSWNSHHENKGLVCISNYLFYFILLYFDKYFISILGTYFILGIRPGIAQHANEALHVHARV